MSFKDDLPKILLVSNGDYDQAYKTLILLAKKYIYEQIFLENEFLKSELSTKGLCSAINGILTIIDIFYGKAACKEAKIEIEMAMEEIKDIIKKSANDDKNETDICETT